LLGLAGGWAYSMPPLALERRGWGELTNALLGSLLMPLMAYSAEAGSAPLRVYLQLAPIVLAALVCIIGVHWADRMADAAVGKYTLAVILGSRVRYLWWACIALTYVLPFVLAPQIIPAAVAWATLLTLPLGLYTAFTATRTDSPVPGAVTMAAVMTLQIGAYAWSS
jgi:1,4-dihydroxy-2-naphthoate octaprenyltransferase